MPIIEPVSENNPELKPIFEQIKEKHGMVPLPFRVMANYPEYFKLVLQKQDTIMSSNVLDTKTKLSIAFTISVLNNCEFCINMYSQQLKKAGFTDQQFVELMAMIDLVGSMNHFNNGMMIKP